MSLFSGFAKAFGAKPKAQPIKKVPSITKPTPPPPSQPAVSPQLTQTIIAEAQTRAREIILEAKDEALKIREQAQDTIRRLRFETEEKSRELIRQEAMLKQRLELSEEKIQDAEIKNQQAQQELETAKNARQKQLEKLEQTAKLTRDQAKEELLAQLDKDLAEAMAKKITAAEEEAQEEAEEKAKEILVDAMKHGATDYVSEYTVSSVKLPDEEVKGRIIGKEGRNIRAFERATGVDIDLDETPGEVRLSSFDSVRREIARLALTRLVADGRIQPSRIEEYVEKAQREVERIMFDEGKKLAHAVGVYNLPKELLEMLGRFKFRFSYGQNMIAHTLEETKIGIGLAREVGANADVVRLGCLLHDIGKIITDEEGSHVDLGVKLLQKFRMPQAVIDCVAQHHEDTPFTSKESVLVYISDAISGARPGARYEDYDEYVKRLTKLEEVAKSFEGVKEAFAIQAGREVRVIVNPDTVNDAQTVKLAHFLKTKIQKELTYPGTVKVNVVREVRATEVAT